MILPDHNNPKEQDKQFEEMNYPKNQDIFNKEKHVPLDNNGRPIEDQEKNDDMEMNLDVPGSELDNEQENIGSEDEENNYWSTSDNDDDHEEQNDDVLG